MKSMTQIRADFPALHQQVHGHDLVYLDNAASTLKCLPVIEALNQHYRMETANIHRGVHFLSEQGTLKYEATRQKVREFINARHEHEIIFTKGTTESINLVAESFGRTFFKAGDQILLTTLEHHSNIVPWQLIAERTGAQVVEVMINDHGEIDLEDYRQKLSPKVKMVATNHISNALGTINPIKEMIALAHEVGAKFLVDGAQSIAHLKVDVQDLDCDFFAFSSHKIFGPTGVGVLYGKENILNAMPPYQGGGDMIDVVTFANTTYNELPHKFEAGTPHIAGVIALKAALDYVDEIGLDVIEAKEMALLAACNDSLASIEGIRLIGTAAHKSAVVSFTMEGLHPHDLGTLLDRMGIAIRTGHHCTQPLMKRLGVSATARASFCFYNTLEEVQRLSHGLIKAREFAG